MDAGDRADSAQLLATGRQIPLQADARCTGTL